MKCYKSKNVYHKHLNFNSLNTIYFEIKKKKKKFLTLSSKETSKLVKESNI